MISCTETNQDRYSDYADGTYSGVHPMLSERGTPDDEADRLHAYADAQAHCNAAALWELFDGDREHLNIAHECIDRHADGGRPRCASRMPKATTRS